jgi:hypothetical protein
VPDDIKKFLWKTAACWCTVEGRTTTTIRACVKKIARYLMETLGLMPVTYPGAVALSRAFSEYASHESVAYGLIIQYPFAHEAVSGNKMKELRRYRHLLFFLLCLHS